MLKEYQEKQQTDIAPLAEQMAEVKAMIESVSRRIKRLASLRGSATDDAEAEQYTADLETTKADKTSLERKLTRLEAEYDWTANLTDDDILAVLNTRQTALSKLQNATFEEKRRYLGTIDLRVTIKNGKARFSSRISVPIEDAAEAPVSGRLNALLHPQDDL